MLTCFSTESWSAFGSGRGEGDFSARAFPSSFSSSVWDPVVGLLDIRTGLRQGLSLSGRHMGEVGDVEGRKAEGVQSKRLTR